MNRLFIKCSVVNLLHPKISMCILHTVFYPFCKVVKRRICSTIKTLFSSASCGLMW